MYGSIEFSKDVINELGAEIPDLVSEPEMLHTQMSFLAEAIREDISMAPGIFDFILNVLSKKDSDVEILNAVCISFIEFPEIEVLGLKAVIPTKIAQILKEQQERWDNAT